MTIPQHSPLVWVIIIGVGLYFAWYFTRSVGGSIPAGGLNNGKS